MSELMHYGKGHLDGGNSGRYPWGSGEDPYQRYMDFYSRVQKVIKDNPGISNDPDKLAEKLGVYDSNGNPSAKMYEKMYKLATAEHKAEQIRSAREMAKKGMGASEIGRAMGKNESTVRGWLNESANNSLSLTKETAEKLKALADKKKYVDVSSGANYYLGGITESKMNDALEMLKDQGYHVEPISIAQQGTDHKTNFNVLLRPGITRGDLYQNKFDIKPVYEEPKTISKDGEITALGLKYKPESIDSSRIFVKHYEEGGVDKDGLIELRPGVPDIGIGASRYAQIRMAVDDKYYAKGMAVYSNDIPPGYDVVINSNKHVGTPLEGSGDNSVLKKMKTKLDGSVNWDNPFGATIKLQKEYEDLNGELHPSKSNIVNDEGDWGNWKKRLSSQFLSKQPKEMAERQLNLDYAGRKEEFEEIKALTNPVVKQKLLIQFADGCDKAAVDLKGAPFPGQQAAVIIPFPELKDNEIYAPNYKDGTVVAVYRHPHEGTFAIPILTVRNKGSIAEKIIGDAPDAVGINKNVADRLSGADFDGDTVTLIPQSDKVRVRSQSPLKDLEGFDAKEEYPGYEGMEVIRNDLKQRKMGEVSNLITDMTFQGASPDELARATKHSQCIIDAEKHELNWKLSEEVNGIKELKDIYQSGGASTIISRAKSPRNVPKRKDWWERESVVDENGIKKSGIDPETGEKVYELLGEVNKSGKLKDLVIATGERVKIQQDRSKQGGHFGEFYYKIEDPETGKSIRKYVKENEFKSGSNEYLSEDWKTGKLFYTEKDPITQKSKRIYVTKDDFTSGIKSTDKTQEVPWMSLAKDAYELTSGGSKEHYGYPIEKVYADYANNMKALGNAARLEFLNTKPIKQNREASEKYKEEVISLNEKLRVALMNAPRERQAQLDAGKTMYFMKRDHPDMSKEQEKKYRGQAIAGSRAKMGAKKQMVELSDKEWEAIQAGAISPTKLKNILDNCNLDTLKEKATPRKGRVISPSMEALAKAMARSGHSRRDIADRLGISPSSVSNIING